jgi:uncharacterized coiled-coil protein SlyX
LFLNPIQSSKKMSGESTKTQLEERLTRLETHVTEQDAEIYRLSRKVDVLVKIAQDQKAQLAGLSEAGADGADTMPANEKPPHY